MRSRIGECLRQAGLISEKNLRRAMAEHARTGERLGVVLVRLQIATEEQIATALASQLGLPYTDFSNDPPDAAAMRLIPEDLARNEACVPIRLERGVLTVAMADPLLFSLAQDLQDRTGYRIKEVVATRSAILNAIAARDPDESIENPASERSAVDGVALDEEIGTVDGLVDRILENAVDSDASDIHIEPTENGLIVRHRVDGVLRESMSVPLHLREDLIVRFKILAGLDVAEKLLPQAGRLRPSTDDGAKRNWRASTLRTRLGEKIVLRAHARQRRVPPLAELGLSDAALEEFRECLGGNRGVILVAGPSGSGKSTTLGAALASTVSPKTSVVTIENPIEYQIPGIHHTEVDRMIGLTFARALRSSLQQDPDIILLGDIPDPETAAAAFDAARAGKLVLAALLADDAVSSVARLREVGAESSAIASLLVGVVAQRIVRRLCTDCRAEYVPGPAVLRAVGIPEVETSVSFFKAIGCDQCDHTGYRGRIGIYEVLRLSDRLRRLIDGRAPMHDIRDAATSGGMVTLTEDGLAKAKRGVTSVDEVLRVVPEVRETRPLCPACGAAVAADFSACPRCGERLGVGCPHCGRALQRGWNFCPYCARSTEPALAAAKRGIIRLVRNPDSSDIV